MSDDFDDRLDGWVEQVREAIEETREFEFDLTAHAAARRDSASPGDRATDAERLFLLMGYADYQSSNGGLWKLYHDEPIDSAEAPQLYEAVGLPRTAAVVREAFAAMSLSGGADTEAGRIADLEFSRHFFDALQSEAPGAGSLYQATSRALAVYVAGRPQDFPSLNGDTLTAAAGFARQFCEVE